MVRHHFTVLVLVKPGCASQATEGNTRFKDVDSEAEDGDSEEDSEDNISDDRPHLKDLLSALPSREAVYKDIIHILEEDTNVWNKYVSEPMTPIKPKKKRQDFLRIALNGYETRSSLPAWWDEDARFECQKLAEEMNYKCSSTLLPSGYRKGGRREREPSMQIPGRPDLDADEMMKTQLATMPREDAYEFLLEQFVGFQKNLREMATVPKDMTQEFLFNGMLDQMAEKNLFPSWWNQKTRRECEKFAADFGYGASLTEEDAESWEEEDLDAPESEEALEEDLEADRQIKAHYAPLSPHEV